MEAKNYIRNIRTAESDGGTGYSTYWKVAQKGVVCCFVFLFLLVTTWGCNNDTAPDCFQRTGEIVRQDIALADFTKITVFENVSLILKHDSIQKVTIETGENLISDVSATVVEGRLELMDTNNCNYARDYGTTIIYVASPNIAEIRSSTGWSIKSDGVLAYDRLTLLSESFNDPTSETTDGMFDLNLDSNNVTVTLNGSSYLKLKGKTKVLGLNIAAGDARIEAADLVAESVAINHRGSNDMLVNPQVSLTGVVRGYGDVISYNRPAIVTLEAIYKGKLIFK